MPLDKTKGSLQKKKHLIPLAEQLQLNTNVSASDLRCAVLERLAAEDEANPLSTELASLDVPASSSLSTIFSACICTLGF